MSRTLTIDEITAEAERLEQARIDRVAIRRTTLRHPGMSIDDAYAVQRTWIDRQVRDGATVAGRKIGLTSKAMQQAMRINEPDFGVMLDSMHVAAGSTLPTTDYLDPKIEVELAFVLGERLEGDAVDRDAVLAATARIVPALELIDARSFRVDPTDGTPRSVLDTISDNAACAGFVLGDIEIDPAVTDLGWVPAVLRCDGEVVETGVAAGVLGDPVLGVVWLARRLARYGVAMEAGEVILCGSFTRPVDCRPGQNIAVEFGDHGSIELDCA